MPKKKSSPKNEYELIDELSRFILDIIMLPNPPDIPERFKDIESLETLYSNLISLRDFLYAASSGDLSKEIPFKGFINGSLRTLHANLKHMIWQTKMVAAGDFTQRIEFMGEFAQSFNSMVIKLDQTLKELVNKKTELSEVNENLISEITIRKETEATLRSSEETLRQLAITDPLTGFFNRRHFFDLGEIEVSRSLRYARPLSIMMYDIDFFKKVNDTYGHRMGDMVIQMITSTSRKLLRTTDIPVRYGGEEFIILLPETGAAEAADVAERLREKIESTPVKAEDATVSITASFGISDYIDEDDDAKSNEKILLKFIDTADKAMYSSKRNGRNRVSVFKPGR